MKPAWPLTVVAVVAAVLAAEIGLVWRERARTQRAVTLLAAKTKERDRLAQQAPAPSAANAAAIAAAVAEAEHDLEQLNGGPDSHRAGDAGVPLDELIALAAFVERMRSRLSEANIAISADERFGFAAYATSAPEAGLLPSVRRQRVAVERLLEALRAARPAALLAVKRMAPEAGATSAKSAGTAGDYFSLPPSLSVRQPGLVDTDGFRLEFTGDTDVLRMLMNELAEKWPALVVRAVEAEAASPAPRALRADEAESAAVRPKRMKFMLTIEAPRTASFPP